MAYFVTYELINENTKLLFHFLFDTLNFSLNDSDG